MHGLRAGRGRQRRIDIHAAAAGSQQSAFPIPFPRGRGRFPGGRFPLARQIGVPAAAGAWGRAQRDEHVNEERAARRSRMTRAAAPKSFAASAISDAATARIADELSKQYYLGYNNRRKKDGKWHAIRVEVKDRRLPCGRERAMSPPEAGRPASH